MLVLIVWYLRPAQNTYAHNLLKYVPPHIDGPSNRYTGDNGVEEINV